MVVVAHPDDEVIAIGARIRRFHEAYFIHATDGAPRNEQDSRSYGFATLDEYRNARRDEFHKALQESGLSHVRCECLGIPDQEASLHLAHLTRRLVALILRHSPQAVLTHPYEGGHPDHDACAFAVHQAVHHLTTQNLPPPLIVEAAFYHLCPRGIETGCFLHSAEPRYEIVCPLTGREQAQKQRLLRSFSTQQATLQYFNTTQECFRIAPHYDFTKPPHHPPVFYDAYPWGMRSQQFCDLAKEAIKSLRRQQEGVTAAP
jgi:LmbE family N-acetylglucosaminyl deacetylase